MFSRKGHNDQKLAHWIDRLFFGLMALGVFIMPVFVLPYTNNALNNAKLLLLFALVGCAALTWLVRVLFVKTVVIRRTMFDAPLGILVIAAVVSSIISASPRISFFGRTDSFVLNAVVIALLALWFWIVVQEIRGRHLWNLLVSALLFGTSLSGLLFLFSDTSVARVFLQGMYQNTLSDTNTAFGIMMAVVAVTGLGFLMVKKRSVWWQIIPTASVLVGIAVMVRLGFTMPLALFAFGCALMSLLGIVFSAHARRIAVFAAFLLFGASVILCFVGVPSPVKKTTPLEVALGVRPSYDVTTHIFLHNATSFLLGSGPGTFSYDFSRFRPEAFNANDYIWSVRFSQPYSTPFSILAEFGLVGFVSFAMIFLLLIGTVVSAWLHVKRSFSDRLREPFESSETDDMTIFFEVFVVAFSFIVATVGFSLSFYDIAALFAWWLLLALSVVGLGVLVPSAIREHVMTIRFSPQHALVTAFGLLLVCGGMSAAGAFVIRYYQADMAYAAATRTNNLNQVEYFLKNAIEKRPQFAPYHIALSRLYLQQARRLSDDPNADAATATTLVASAVNEAKEAADMEKNDVGAWETLGLMYMNARTLTPEANTWANDAIAHALTLEPTNPVLHAYAGNIAAFDKKYDDAQASYERAISLKSDYLPAYSELASVYEEQGAPEKAVALYTDLNARFPNNPEVLYALGRLYFNRNQKDDVENARVSWERAVQLMPDFSNALYSLGLLYEKQGLRGKAIDMFQRVQELNPDNIDVKKKIESLK